MPFESYLAWQGVVNFPIGVSWRRIDSWRDGTSPSHLGSIIYRFPIRAVSACSLGPHCPCGKQRVAMNTLAQPWNFWWHCMAVPGSSSGTMWTGDREGRVRVIARNGCLRQTIAGRHWPCSPYPPAVTDLERRNQWRGKLYIREDSPSGVRTSPSKST